MFSITCPEEFPNPSGHFVNTLPAYAQYPGSVLVISCQDIGKTSREILQLLRRALSKQTDKFS
jgi:hypothetical protein